MTLDLTSHLAFKAAVTLFCSEGFESAIRDECFKVLAFTAD